eukprot:gb/GECG01016755.1/.p1 GENE.gb/GECG01016755.1/~~gb/GECG01016755.1/.p1  ORF type:complete len:493 (+),score=68.93 gb/GECG01016755.1/:1-1479(+)
MEEEEALQRDTETDIRYILESFAHEQRMSYKSFKRVWKSIKGPLLHQCLADDHYDTRQFNYLSVYTHLLAHLREPNLFIRLGVIYAVYTICWSSPYQHKTPIKVCPETWKQILSLVRFASQYELSRVTSQTNGDTRPGDRCDVGDIVRFLYHKRMWSFGLYNGPEGFEYISLKAQRRISFGLMRLNVDPPSGNSSTAPPPTCLFELHDTGYDLPQKSRNASEAQKKMKNEERLLRNYRRNASFIYARASGRLKGQNHVEWHADGLDSAITAADAYRSTLRNLESKSSLFKRMNLSAGNEEFDRAADLLTPTKRRKKVEGNVNMECFRVPEDASQYLSDYVRPRKELQLMRARWTEIKKQSSESGWVEGDTQADEAVAAQAFRPNKNPKPRDTFAPAYLFEHGGSQENVKRKFAVGCVDMGLNLNSINLSSHSKICHLLTETDIPADRKVCSNEVLEEVSYANDAPFIEVMSNLPDDEQPVDEGDGEEEDEEA